MNSLSSGTGSLGGGSRSRKGKMEKDLDLPRDDHLKNVDIQDLSNLKADPNALTCASIASDTIVSRSSLDSDGGLSFAVQVNDRLGKLLGYVGVSADRLDVGDTLATITGYEIITKNNEKFTVSLILFTLKTFKISNA